VKTVMLMNFKGVVEDFFLVMGYKLKSRRMTKPKRKRNLECICS
jgi:hypothetical protein